MNSPSPLPQPSAVDVNHVPAYRMLYAAAEPLARADVDAMIAHGVSLSDPAQWQHEIQAAYASTSLLTGQTLQEVARRHSLSPEAIAARAEGRRTP